MTAAARTKEQVLLRGRGLRLETREGRVLVEGLHVDLGLEAVAIVGRNGVGKSTLLRALAGRASFASGERRCEASTHYVAQELVCAGQSHGETRRRALARAFSSGAKLLFLDEPAQSLDEEARAWLLRSIAGWRRGLVVVSHDSELLALFGHFFVVDEGGCRYFRGTYAELVASLAAAHAERERAYLSRLADLERRERANDKLRRGRERKKNRGRVNEIDRCPSRALLNTNRSYAQESQARRNKIREARIKQARRLVKASRRRVPVKFSLQPLVPTLPAARGDAIVVLQGAGFERAGRVIVSPLDLELRRECVAVTGVNGAGKTSLLSLASGELRPSFGRAFVQASRVAVIHQRAENWCRLESTLEMLVVEGNMALDAAIQILASHRFPLALAERPLRSLSPGERVRAALLCLFARQPAPELLVLDEPSCGLDPLGSHSLRIALERWEGGLLVATHDRALLDALAVDRVIRLPPQNKASR